MTPYSHITLETDNVFNDGWEQQSPQVSGDVRAGYTAGIDVPIDTTTPNAGGGAAPNMGGGPGENAGPGEPPSGPPPGGMPPLGG